MSDQAGDGGIRIRERPTPRTARFALLGAEPSSARRIWIALHGYGMLASRFLRAFAGTVPADSCIVAPEGLSRFYLELPRTDGSHLQKVGATWLTRESRETEIIDAHRWLDLVHDEVVAESIHGTGTSPSIGILGFSQGVATAMRWIAEGHVRPRRFVAWAGGLAADVDPVAFTTSLQDGDFIAVVGDDDPFVTPRAVETLQHTVAGWGLTHRIETFHGGHQLEPTVLAALLASLSGPSAASDAAR